MKVLRRFLLLGALLCPGVTILGAEVHQEQCTVTIQVMNCSRAPESDLTVEIVIGDRRLQARSDADGEVVFEECAQEIVEVNVYLEDDADPMSSSPVFEPIPDSPQDSTAIVIVC